MLTTDPFVTIHDGAKFDDVLVSADPGALVLQFEPSLVFNLALPEEGLDGHALCTFGIGAFFEEVGISCVVDLLHVFEDYGVHLAFEVVFELAFRSNLVPIQDIQSVRDLMLVNHPSLQGSFRQRAACVLVELDSALH